MQFQLIQIKVTPRESVTNRVNSSTHSSCCLAHGGFLIFKIIVENAKQQQCNSAELQ